MHDTQWLEVHEIKRIAQESVKSRKECSCSAHLFQGWESMPITFPETELTKLGEIKRASDEEPTFTEYHPEGTHYWSPNAPIALNYFPYNRCSTWQCTQCGCCFLRYTESGGYYIDHRIRMLDPDLIADIEHLI